MKRSPRFVAISTTVAGLADARKLALLLVRERLAACAQFMPIRSIYRWKGKVESADEHLILLKTRESLASTVVTRVRSVHPYELPEIVVTPIAGGLGEYLKWIGAETVHRSRLDDGVSGPKRPRRGRIRADSG